MPPTRFASSPVDASPLGRPLAFPFSGKAAPNRLLKAAMSERLATWDAVNPERRGVPTRELINVYRRWGEGGYGVILTGNFMLDYDQLEAPGNPIIPPGAPFEGERFDGFKGLAEAAKKEGSLVYAQVGHPGRQVSAAINPNPVSASDVQLEGRLMGSEYGKPRALEEKEIGEVVERFAFAAEYCYKAGYDGVQLHAAHGYLIAQFLSPTTNKRNDKYGGSLANRARFLLEIAAAIRSRVPDEGFSLGVKVNSVEFQDGGFSTQDCAELCAALEEAGFDWVELSGGTYQELGFSHRRESTRKREAFFLEFAEGIVPLLKKTKVYVTGGLRTVEAMAEALKSVDGVGIGRPVTDEFDLGKKLIGGEVAGAVRTLLPHDDFGVTGVSAGTQMKLVGEDREPLDLSREDHVAVFGASMGKWAKGMAENGDGSRFGYVDVEGVELQPYGTPYAAAA
ncbi:nadh oxidase [Colletotrichum sojae]|uniref:Nadh oxidase n=1 Tax=Colletotrichum sojae TaxID=2175907 RepID=A0A8H6MRS0_9PEZI|nr:nadh oxidase [Colletotrichum sojae]